MYALVIYFCFAISDGTEFCESRNNYEPEPTAMACNIKGPLKFAEIKREYPNARLTGVLCTRIGDGDE